MTNPPRAPIAAGLPVLVVLVGVTLGTAAQAKGIYVIDPADQQYADRLARTFRRAGGLAAAWRAFAQTERMYDHELAFTVLYERAAVLMPRLLQAVAAGVSLEAAEKLEVWHWPEEAHVVLEAVCYRRTDRDTFGIDRASDPAAQRRRAAAHRALLRALRTPGARRTGALIMLRAAGAGLHLEGGCEGSRALMRLAKPAIEALRSADQEPELTRLLLASY